MHGDATVTWASTVPDPPANAGIVLAATAMTASTAIVNRFICPPFPLQHCCQHVVEAHPLAAARTAVARHHASEADLMRRVGRDQLDERRTGREGAKASVVVDCQDERENV